MQNKIQIEVLVESLVLMKNCSRSRIVAALDSGLPLLRDEKISSRGF